MAPNPQKWHGDVGFHPTLAVSFPNILCPGIRWNTWNQVALNDDIGSKNTWLWKLEPLQEEIQDLEINMLGLLSH